MTTVDKSPPPVKPAKRTGKGKKQHLLNKTRRQQIAGCFMAIAMGRCWPFQLAVLAQLPGTACRAIRADWLRGQRGVAGMPLAKFRKRSITHRPLCFAKQSTKQA